MFVDFCKTARLKRSFSFWILDFCCCWCCCCFNMVQFAICCNFLANETANSWIIEEAIIQHLWIFFLTFTRFTLEFISRILTVQSSIYRYVITSWKLGFLFCFVFICFNSTMFFSIFFSHIFTTHRSREGGKKIFFSSCSFSN